ncbi:MAG: c-type cytochrome [Terriglobia bacterium]
MKLRWVRTLGLCIVTLAISGLAVAATPDAHQGGELFQSQHCVMCHGANGKGYAAIHTPDFTSAKWQARHSDQQIAHVISHGKPGTRMPAFGTKVTSSQIQDLVAYIRSLGSEKTK